MKVSLVLLVLVGFGCVLSEERCTKKRYEEYKAKYGKKYPTAKIEEIHFKRYCDSLDLVNKINEDYKNGKSTWSATMNQFADLTDEELQKEWGVLKPDNSHLQHKPDNSTIRVGANKTKTV